MGKGKKHVGLLLLVILTFPFVCQTVHAIPGHSDNESYSYNETSVTDLTERCSICSFEYAKASIGPLSPDCRIVSRIIEKIPRITGDQSVVSFSGSLHNLRAPPVIG